LCRFGPVRVDRINRRVEKLTPNPGSDIPLPTSDVPELQGIIGNGAPPVKKLRIAAEPWVCTRYKRRSSVQDKHELGAIVLVKAWESPGSDRWKASDWFFRDSAFSGTGVAKMTTTICRLEQPRRPAFQRLAGERFRTRLKSPCPQRGSEGIPCLYRKRFNHRFLNSSSSVESPVDFTGECK